MIRGAYYDGQTTGRLFGNFQHDETRILIQLDSGKQIEHLFENCETQPIADSQPIHIRCDSGEGMELPQSEEAREIVARISMTAKARSTRWREGRLGLFCGLFVAILASLFVWQRVSPESFARALKQFVPSSFNERLGHRQLLEWDNSLFQPSALSATRQREIRRRFDALVYASGYRESAILNFRAGNDIFGPNALALPGGQIVLFDSLVSFAASDDEIIGVLAHELGHEHFEHALQGMIHDSLIRTFSTLVFGSQSVLGFDYNTTISLQFTRQDEKEADRFAREILLRNGDNPGALGELLQRLSAGSEKERGILARYQSTHPSTRDRVLFLTAPDSNK